MLASHSHRRENAPVPTTLGVHQTYASLDRSGPRFSDLLIFKLPLDMAFRVTVQILWCSSRRFAAGFGGGCPSRSRREIGTTHPFLNLRLMKSRLFQTRPIPRRRMARYSRLEDMCPTILHVHNHQARLHRDLSRESRNTAWPSQSAGAWVSGGVNRGSHSAGR